MMTPRATPPIPLRMPARAPFMAATAVDGPRARTTLSAAERRIGAQLPSAQRRRDYRVGRLAARRALGRLRETEGAVVSVAHRDGLAVAAAVAGPARVGVDLERRFSVSPPEGRFFLTPAE